MTSSKAWKAFEPRAILELQSQYKKRKPITQELAIDITFLLKGKRRTDIDNKLSGVFDLLMKAGVIEDDSQIVTVTARKYNKQPEDFAEINLLI